MDTDTRSITTRPQTLPAAMGMRYYEEVLDRKTGDLVSVDRGDWITLGELSTLLDIGRRQLTTILREMNFLQIEGVGRDTRHRVCDWVLDKGWAKRNRRKTDKYPFDVLSPEAVQWVSKNWEAAKSAVEKRTSVQPVSEARDGLSEFKQSRGRFDMSCEAEARWLADFYPRLTHEQMATVLDVTRQLIDRFMKRKIKQLEIARALKAQHR